ncbi:hypothetical protein GF337_03090 [candidate division KSB1 bacterium]|nr:hypothetical protein [candidate division KSB1 bacterium]
MLKNLRIFIIAFIGILLLGSQIYAQETFEGYWEQTTKSNSPYQTFSKSKGDEAQRVYYKNGKMKIEDKDGGNVVIMRLDKEVTWMIDKKKGVYTEMTMSDMKAQMNKANEAMQKMQKQMEDMPPEQRKMMEKMMGDKMKSMASGEGMNITVKKTDETKTINGYNCRKIVYYSGDEPIMDIWLTDKYQLGSEFVKSYAQMGLIKGDLSEATKNMKGFPIKSEMQMDAGMGKKIESTTTVTKIVPTSVSDSQFELPKGLKKTEMNSFQ